MTRSKRWGDEEISRLLESVPDGSPPPDLLSRLQADIPETIEAGAWTEPTSAPRSWARVRPLYRIAAALFLTVGTGYLAFRSPRTEPAAPIAPAIPAVHEPVPQAVAPPMPVATIPPTPVPARVETPAPRAKGPAATRSWKQASGNAVSRRSRSADRLATVTVTLMDCFPADDRSSYVFGITNASAALAGAATVQLYSPVLSPPSGNLEAKVALANAAPSGAAPWTEGSGHSFSEPIGDARFIDTTRNARSKFPLPIGTESYTVGRQYLRNDALPEPASVRVEDYLNFFDYEDLSPRKEDFAITMEGGSSYAPRGPDYRFLRIGVKAVAPGEEERSTPNLTRFLQAIAYDTETEVEFNPKVVSRYRLVGYENRAGYGRYRDDSVEGGGVRAGHRTTALYEVKLVSDAEPQTLATVHLSYRPGNEKERREITRSISSGQIEESWAEASRSLQLAVAVATYAEVLKKTHWNRNFDLFDLAARLEQIATRWPDDERVQELAQLARRAASLSRPPEGR